MRNPFCFSDLQACTSGWSWEGWMGRIPFRN